MAAIFIGVLVALVIVLAAVQLLQLVGVVEEPVVRHWCECGKPLRGSDLHVVAEVWDGPDELGGEGGSALVAEFCAEHCPGGCRRGCGVRSVA